MTPSTGKSSPNSDQANNDNQYCHKIFGHLYVAIFSNGAAKAGMSRSNPLGRIASHKTSGQKFGISMTASYCAAIYTDDVFMRESRMHTDVSRVAARTVGREWFKFKTDADAINFSSTYLEQVERMSFSERPSQEAILAAQEEERISAELNRVSARGLLDAFSHSSGYWAPLDSVLNEMSAIALLSIADKVMDMEEIFSQKSDDFDSGMPKLRDAIDRYCDARVEFCDARSSGGEADPNVVTDAAKNVIRVAAVNYHDFYMSALSLERSAA